jgi:hypothetical protein
MSSPNLSIICLRRRMSVGRVAASDSRSDCSLFDLTRSARFNRGRSSNHNLGEGGRRDVAIPLSFIECVSIKPLIYWFLKTKPHAE